MTLATHMVVGAAAAKVLTGNPALGFAIGFASHFLLDAIIHWDYKLASAKSEIFLADSTSNLSLRSKAALTDMLKVSTDAALGFLFVFVFLYSDMFDGVFGMFSGVPADSSTLILLLAGAIGGALPDFLQFVFLLWKTKPIVVLQKFHQWIHAKKDLNDRPMLGISLQLILIALVVAGFNLLQLQHNF